MRFRIPGRSIHIRLFEKVETADSQYHVYDTGLDYADGSVDSIAVGGSFATLEKLASKADEDALKKAKKKAKKSAKKAAAEATPSETDGVTPEESYAAA